MVFSEARGNLWIAPLLCDNEGLLPSDKVKELLAGVDLGVMLAVAKSFAHVIKFKGPQAWSLVDYLNIFCCI